MKPIKVLSLFDGISCGQLALKNLGFKISSYYASEVHLPNIKITARNFPSTIHLGDVRWVCGTRLPKIDLILAGSPCQGFSSTGNHLNFKHPESKLFFEFVRILKECQKINPKIKFLLENVVMKKEWVDTITNFVGTKPIKINSRLVSAQNRPRIYWTNIIGVAQPEDRYIYLKDILELPYKNKKGRNITDYKGFNGGEKILTSKDKSPTLLKTWRLSTTPKNCYLI